MNVEKAFKTVEAKGLLKSSSAAHVELSSRQKVTLNRRGNELFNAGNVDDAVKMFLLTNYSDGLSRMGDLYMEQQRLVDALKIYYKANMPAKYDPLAQKAALVIRSLLEKGENSNE